MITTRPSIVPALFACLLATSAGAAVECRQPTSQDDLILRVEQPEPGSVLVASAPCCPLTVPLEGKVGVGLLDFDFYFVLDSSGSTGQCSGADIDEDGVLCGPGDTILAAEVAAVRSFVRSLSPAASRVALLQFSMPEQQLPGARQRIVRSLTSDFAQIESGLDEILAAGALGATDYGGGLELVRQEFQLNGQPATRNQQVYFMSDGVPTYPQGSLFLEDPEDSRLAIDAAELLATEGLVVNTFGVGFTPSETQDPALPPRCLDANGDRVSTLECVALRTGGSFLASNDPADIVDQIGQTLPSIGIDRVELLNLANADSGLALLGPDGVWTGQLALTQNQLNPLRAEAFATDGSSCAADTDITPSCQRERKREAPECGCAPRTQGFWKRQCRGRHPSGESQRLESYLGELRGWSTFAGLEDTRQLCQVLDPEPKHDKCRQAEAQFAALLLNIASGRLAGCCVVGPEGPLEALELAQLVDELLAAPDRDFGACVEAQQLADDANTGKSLCRLRDYP